MSSATRPKLSQQNTDEVFAPLLPAVRLELAREVPTRPSFTVRVIAPVLLSCATLLLVPALAVSETYKWNDAAGRDYFGSKPPKGALNVEAVSGKSFSRYSSSKALTPYARGNFASKLNEQPIESIKRPRKEVIKSSKKVKESAEPLVLEPETPPEGADLAQGPVDVRFGEGGEVTHCSVTVKNTTIIPARNVIATFEFEDGTLIPGVGPEVLDGDTEGTYAVPNDVLPLRLKLDPEKAALPPRVTIRAE